MSRVTNQMYRQKQSLMFHSIKENAYEAMQYRLEQDVRNEDRETKKA